MNYNTLRNKPTINYRELIGDSTVTEVGGITEEEFNTLMNTDLTSYYTKEQIDELFARSYVFREKSGDIVTFDCPTTTNGIAQVTSEIVAVQSGSGDPSPTNIRPISGWSAVNVNRSAKNMFKIPSEFVDRTSRGITVSGNSDMTYNVSGLSTNNASINLADNSATSNYYTTQQLSNTIKYPAGTYTISGETNTEEGGFSIIYGTNIGAVYSAEGNGYENIKNKSVTITMATEWYMNPLFSINNNKQVSDNAYLKVQVERGEEATTYEPYNGTTYTTTLKDGQGNPLECYGGELTNENGVQRLDRASGIIVDMGELTWTYVNQISAFRTSLSSYKKNSRITPNALCEIAKPYSTNSFIANTSLVGFSFGDVGAYDNNILLRLDGITTTEDLLTVVRGKKMTFELATPQTIPQDNLAIATQDGTNNLWADSGDITVKALDRIIQG